MQAKNMHSLIFYFTLALLSTPSFSRSSSEDSSTLDLATIRNAAQILKVLQQINEHSAEVHAPSRAYKHQLKQKGLSSDYIGYSDEQYIDISKLVRLLQKNYEASQNNALTGGETKPRLYFISNPEILEQYWRNMKGEESSEAPRGSGNQYSAGINTNLLKYIISQRRDGDDDIDETTVKEDEATHQFRTISPNEEPQAQSNEKAGRDDTAFKSRDDYDDKEKGVKREKKTTFNYKVPVKVTRDDASIAKSIEKFKSTWKMKKPESNSYRPSKIIKRYDDPPERSRYSKPRSSWKGSGRSGNMGSNYGYGYSRTPVPFVGKRGIYEED